MTTDKDGRSPSGPGSSPKTVEPQVGLDASHSIPIARDTAAVTDLLDALHRIEERAGDMSHSSTSRCGDIGRIARAAIAKATAPS